MHYETISGVGLQSTSYPDCHIVAQTIPSPAAGADFVITVPQTGGVWELVSASAQLVTSGNVANRQVSVAVKDNAGNVVYKLAFDTFIVASKTWLMTFSPAVTSLQTAATNALVGVFPVPSGPYLPGFTIGSVTGAIDGSDQWSAVNVWWRGYFPDYGSGSNE